MTDTDQNVLQSSLVHVQDLGGGGGGVTVTEKREILAGWVTKVCLKCTEKLG